MQHIDLVTIAVDVLMLEVYFRELEVETNSMYEEKESIKYDLPCLPPIMKYRLNKSVSRYVGGQLAKAAKRQHGSRIPGH